MQTLIGHHTVQSQLVNLLESQRFPHAILLHGPRGIGKRLLAEHLAYRLICGPKSNEISMFGAGQGAQTLSHDNTSPQAAQLAAASCPDYHTLSPDDGKKSISIKQVRELLEVLSRSADTARTLIIDALEDLTPEAANTLLKSLEEPRPGIFFILISHQLSAVLPTIRSRCRLLPVTPLSLEEVTQVLEEHNLSTSSAPLAHGAPGSVMGAAAITRRKVLESLKSGTLPAANTENLLPILLSHLASQPTSLATATTYRKLAELHQKQQEINLPSTIVNEAALAHIKP